MNLRPGLDVRRWTVWPPLRDLWPRLTLSSHPERPGRCVMRPTSGVCYRTSGVGTRPHRRSCRPPPARINDGCADELAANVKEGTVLNQLSRTDGVEPRGQQGDNARRMRRAACGRTVELALPCREGSSFWCGNRTYRARWSTIRLRSGIGARPACLPAVQVRRCPPRTNPSARFTFPTT